MSVSRRDFLKTAAAVTAATNNAANAVGSK